MNLISLHQWKLCKMSDCSVGMPGGAVFSIWKILEDISRRRDCYGKEAVLLYRL